MLLYLLQHNWKEFTYIQVHQLSLVSWVLIKFSGGQMTDVTKFKITYSIHMPVVFS